MSEWLSWTFLVPVITLVVGLVLVEVKGLSAKDIMPVVVMSAAAVVGRVIFAFVPQVQPVTAIVIIMGYCYGVSGGFLTGALTGLVSSLFMGLGPWTPWQMFAWGVIGALSGVLGKANWCRKWWFLLPYSALTGFAFSIIMDVWTISTLGDGLTVAMALSTFGAGLVFNISHAVSNVIFVLLLYKPLEKRFSRIKLKYQVLK